jgi:hypothetical protein
MHRRFLGTSAIAAVVTAVFLTGSGVGASAVASRGAQAKIPAALAAAIHARFGFTPTRSAKDSPTEHPDMGGSVAMSADGTTALVTAPGAGNGKGAAYIYHVANAGSWVSSATPAATLSGVSSHGFGEALGWVAALSADGTTAFLGAPFAIDLDAQTLGAVEVFHVSSESAWTSTSTPTATLTVDNGGSFGFGLGGLAVSPDGTTVVAGSSDYNQAAGGAYVFHVSSEGAWTSTSTSTATLSNSADAEGVGNGWPEVAISGDGATVLLSAAFSSKPGRAYLYHVASAAAWTSSTTPTAILSNANGAPVDLLGYGLALSDDGTTAFVGAPGVKGFTGAVDVFHVANAALWLSSSTPTAILTNGGGAKGDFLGTTFAVSTDGKTVVTGASGVNHNTGAVYVFRASGEDAWTSTAAPTAKLNASAGTRGDNAAFRGLVSSSDGATVLFGAPGFNWSTGEAHVFHVADAGSWATSSKPTATLRNSALPKPRCIVPGLKRESVSLAKYDLANANCRLGKVKRVHSTKKNRKRIVSQSPARGHNLPPGSKVNVKVGK